MTYRPEIDGLRAIAILAILFFHIGFDLFGGGFIGVDVFFVISGYLITQLIVKEVDTSGTFNFSRFYLRRAQRLLPSLFFVLFFSLIFSYFLFTPELLKRFGSSLVSSLLSISNMYFWRESGYFDISSSFKPLLHTWALSVEVQFYFIWPTVIAFILNRSKKNTTLVLFIISIAFVSFVLNEKFLSNNTPFLKLYFPKIFNYFLEGKSTVFYLTPFRVFEFMIGAILVCFKDIKLENRLVNEIVSILGLTGIAYPIFFYNNTLPYPSFYALVPCLGTALIIYSTNAKLSYRILSSKILVFVGLISYTLYLVHWPIIVFYKYYKVSQIVFWEQVVIILFSLIISIIIYFVIEQPLRNRYWGKAFLSTKQFVVTCAAFALILLLAGYYLHSGTIRGNNFIFDEDEVIRNANRLVNNEICYLENNSKKIKERISSSACNTQAKYQILTIGNSHEIRGYKVIRNLYLSDVEKGNLNIVYSSTHVQGEFKNENNPRCYFHHLDNLPLRSINPDCEWLATTLTDYKKIGSQFNAIIVSALQPLDPQVGRIYMDYVNELQKVNPELKIVVIGSLVSIGQNRCADLINRTQNPSACNDDSLVSYYNPQEEDDIKEKWPDLRFFYLDQRFLFCGNRGYEECEITVNDIPIFFDGSHLNVIGITELLSRLENSKIGEKLSAYLFSETTIANHQTLVNGGE